MIFILVVYLFLPSSQCSPTAREGVLRYAGYIGMYGPKGYGFLAVFVINRHRSQSFCRHFGHKQGIDFCTLVFNSVFFSEEASPSPIYALPSSTPSPGDAGQIKSARKALHRFMFIKFFGQVINRMGKIADFGHKQGEGFGKRAAHPYLIFLESPLPRSPGLLHDFSLFFPVFFFLKICSRMSSVLHQVSQLMHAGLDLGTTLVHFIELMEKPGSKCT